ncbi:MAG TPA: capsule assembly Wzi family protein [Rhizomicrobium sp.]
MRTRYFCWEVVLALLLCFGGLSPASASPWAEVGDNQLRSDIELLQSAGVIQDITTQWPLPWASLQGDLGGVDLTLLPSPLRSAAERVLARADAATAPGAAAWASLDATNKPNVVYGFDGMGRGEGQAQLSAEATSGAFSGRVSLGAFTNNFTTTTVPSVPGSTNGIFFGSNTKLMPDGSYGSVRLGDVRLYAGYLDQWWGPGNISALSLSNNARPMPQVGIERADTRASSWPVLRWLGPWQFDFFLGYLDGPRLVSNTYYNAGRFVIHPFNGFEIGVARYQEFCGDGHPCSPIKDYFHFSNNPNSIDNTNDEATWDVKYSHTLAGIPFQAYLQLMNEDYSWFNHSGTSHLFGLSAFLPAPENPIRLTAEFSDSIATLHPFSFGSYIYGFSYTNGQYLDGMRYRGRTLGFSLDDDSTLLTLQGSWSDSAGRFYELSFHHATIGTRNSTGANIVSPVPVLLNLGEARMSVPWHGWKIDLAGRVQDNQPYPHKGFAAGGEIALRAPL